MHDLLPLAKRVLNDEAALILEISNRLDETFEKVCLEIFHLKGTVLTTGMGKSGIIARKWASTLTSTGTPSFFIDPASASHGDLGILRPGDLLIVLSLRGETDELCSILNYASELQIPIVGVTGNPHSSLARASKSILEIPLLREACPMNLAPTSSTTAMVALGDSLAVSLMVLRGFSPEKFAKLHPGGALGRNLNLKVSQLMHSGDQIPKVYSHSNLAEVLIEMSDKGLGITTVYDGTQLVGVITDGDLRRTLQKGGTNLETKASEIMTRSPKSIGASSRADAAKEKMQQNAIQHLLVVEDSKLVGILHIQALLRARIF